MEFNDLYNKYINVVYSYLNFKIRDSGLVEDIVQEVFVSLYKGLEDLDNVDNLRAYILKVTHRRMVDALRKTKGNEVCIEKIDEEGYYKEEAYDNLFSQDLLKSLDDISKTIIYGVYIEKLTYEELANILEIPEGTVKSKCFYAKRKLKERLLKD